MKDEPQRIFIVEDEVMVAFEMSDILEDLGFDIVGPSIHLEDAEAKARNSEIDVALLDVNMGSKKTTKPVAEILRERGIPFVFITAYDSEHITFLLPGETVLRKPVSSHSLVEAIRQVWPEIAPDISA